jgi:hypothetical protein
MAKLYRRSCDGCGQDYAGRGGRFCSRHCAKAVHWQQRDTTSSAVQRPSTTSSKSTTSSRRKVQRPKKVQRPPKYNVPESTTSSPTESTTSSAPETKPATPHVNALGYATPWRCAACGFRAEKRLLKCPIRTCRSPEPLALEGSSSEEVAAALDELDTPAPPNVTSISEARERYGAAQ